VVTQALGSLEQISAKVKSIESAIETVSATAQQSSSSSQQMSAGVQQTSSSMQQVASAAQQLASTSEELKGMVEQFKLSDSDTRGSVAPKVTHFSTPSSSSPTFIPKVHTNGVKSKVPDDIMKKIAETKAKEESSIKPTALA
jgi:uncharacterized phage infection (PIP) family protein YhgE